MRGFRLGRDLQMVLDQPGWCRGDLRAHTPDSFDAYGSGSPLTPRQWADTRRESGLGPLALTDHDVVSQDFAIAEDAGGDVLLMEGEEMTAASHPGAGSTGGSAPDGQDVAATSSRPVEPGERREG